MPHIQLYIDVLFYYISVPCFLTSLGNDLNWQGQTVGSWDNYAEHALVLHSALIFVSQLSWLESIINTATYYATQPSTTTVLSWEKITTACQNNVSFSQNIPIGSLLFWQVIIDTVKCLITVVPCILYQLSIISELWSPSQWQFLVTETHLFPLQLDNASF